MVPFYCFIERGGSMNNRDFWMGYMMGSCEGEGSGSGGGDGSGILAVLSVVGGLVVEALFLTLLDIEVTNVPVLLLLVGWVIGMVVVTFVLMLIFKR